MKAMIYGSGEHGRIVMDILQHAGIETIGFLDDNIKSHGTIVNEVPVLGGFEIVKKGMHDVQFIVALGDNAIRAQKYSELEKAGKILLNAIHPGAIISKHVTIGKGVVIAPNSVINTGAVIGNNVIINTGAIIEHDNIIEDNSHVAPGVCMAGGVRVKNGATVGIGAIVLDDLTIGRNATIGAGAVVTKDVPDNAVIVGIPAKVIKYKNKRES
ncbi:MAG: acetyltransferase [Candidatus Methanoperedens sp.]|nr:acetyltransferase [Candidatus Methanoperedens sp.]